MHDPLLVSGGLFACVVVAELLSRVRGLRHAGNALLVILVGAIAANLGWLPTATGDVPVYDAVFRIVAPLGIFWLLLDVRLAVLKSVGGPLVGLFFLGAAGTVLGALAGLSVAGWDAFGSNREALGGMFVGTYTGGSANFNAIALEYEMQSQPVFFAAANAVDAAATTVWMALTLLLPRLLSKRPRTALAQDGGHPDAEELSPLSIAVTLGLGLFALAASHWVAAATELPMILVLTTLALLLAQLPHARHLAGTRALGMLAVLVFLAVIGALCDVDALIASGDQVVKLVIFVSVLLTVHGIVLFGGGALLRVDPDLTAVASQAGIGGGTTALALARSLGRADLVLPAVLVGSVGTATGTYLGLMAARVLFA